MTADKDKAPFATPVKTTGCSDGSTVRIGAENSHWVCLSRKADEAEYIANAINAHDGLVAALKYVRKHVGIPSTGKMIDAALAAAGEETA